MPINRRSFLQSAGAGLLGAAVLEESEGSPAGAATPMLSPLPGVPVGGGRLPAVPFHGVHQAGVLTPQQPAALFAGFDIVATTPRELIELFKELTTQARFVAQGGTPPDLGIGRPPADSGILGPVVPPDGLTVTVSVGSSLFDDRFGLADLIPVHLTRMRAFPNDNLNQAECHGDVMLQICAGSADANLHALRLITKHTRGAMQVRYRLDGFVSPPRPSGASRNLLGFKDGIANPPVTTMPVVAQDLLWAGDDEPAWAGGGTYQVMRIIRMNVEFWDRVSVEEQENMFGRRKDNGAPLTGNNQDDVPDYADDPQGAVIPLNCHIRLANPRTPATSDSRILRRGYNYDRGVDVNGNLDMGLIFACYQQNVQRQFEAVQTRLNGEPLVDYVSPTGGGYFFVLPGVRDEADWYTRTLLS